MTTIDDALTTYRAAFMRIWDEAGRAILGAGALATSKGLALTCAHVVGERDTVRLDFPFLSPRRFFTARVVRRDAEADLAALRLEGEPPAGAHPMPFALAEDVRKHPFWVCGFPRGYDAGVWANGVLLAPTVDRGWVQMEAERTTGFAVQRGFSGAPVWDDRLNAAVGLVVTAAGERETRAAFCIPTAALLRFWPELEAHARPPNLSPPPPESRNVRIHGEVRDSVIITGDNNVVVKVSSQKEPPPTPEARDILERRLRMARRALAILEEQAAGYTSLTLPVHLRIELEDKRREVEELERRLGRT